MTRVKHLLARKGRDVWSVEADQPILEAIRIMAERHVGALRVLRGGQLIGLVSERDYARKVVLQGRSSKDTPVRDIMTAEVMTVGLNDSADRCMQLVTDRRIRHLPVLDGDAVLGVVSIGDLVKAVIEDQQLELDQLQRYIAS